MDVEAQRIDQWLWCARFVKSRTSASKLADAGGIRLTRNGATSRVEKASSLLRPGDRLAFTLNDRLRIIGVMALAARRGPASEAQTLYEDLTPTEQESAAAASRGPRPTKADRRAIEKLRQRHEGM